MKISYLKAAVSGVVQGVGYRYYVLREANRLGVTGYVKNLPNGEVEVFAEAEQPMLQIFLNNLRIGPAFSQVENVEVEWGESESKYTAFKIAY